MKRCPQDSKCTCASAPVACWRFFATCGELVENVGFTEMFIDTALMYVLQAVSEQLLHTPELLNTVYHIMHKDGILFYGAICKFFGRLHEEQRSIWRPYGGRHERRDWLVSGLNGCEGP